MKRSILLGLFFALLINIQSFATVTFLMKNYSAQVGSDITIPVKVTGFTNIVSIQGTIHFDSTKLTLMSVQEFGLSGMTQLSNFNLFGLNTSKLTFLWSEASLNGINLSDSTTIFSIKFHVIGSAGQMSPLTFINVPAVFEVVDGNFNTIGYNLVNGSVNIYTTISIPEIQGNGFKLFQNVPNPVTEDTHILFSLPVDGIVSFTVYDMLGNKVTDLQEEFQGGNRSITWNANNIKGVKLPGGTYYYRVSCGKYTDTGKMLVIR